MKSVVFLDLDETLVAQERAFAQSFEAVGRLCGATASEVAAVAERAAERAPFVEVVRRCCFGGRDILWADAGDATAAERTIAAAADSYRRDVWSAFTGDGARARAQPRGLGEAFRRSMQESMEVFPDVLPALRRLRRAARVVVITNGMQRAQQVKLERLGLADHVDRLIASTEVGRGKPAREIFEYALSEMRIDRAHAAMVGDSLEGDVRGARRSGISAVWVNRGGVRSSAGDFSEIHDLAELEAVL